MLLFLVLPGGRKYPDNLSYCIFCLDFQAQGNISLRQIHTGYVINVFCAKHQQAAYISVLNTRSDISQSTVTSLIR